MPQNINSAYRIREILNSLRSKPDNTPTHEIWAEVFSLEESDQDRKNVSIARCLADLHDEVELVRDEMLKLGYSENLFDSSLKKCNTVFAVQSIMGQWKGHKQQITPEVIVALGFCSEILPNEEELIDESNLDELRDMASDLRASLTQSNLPVHTKHIIEKHLNKIDEAIFKYKVVGAKALNEVMQSAYGEVIVSEAVFEEARGSEELGKLSAMWQKTKSVLDGVVDTNKRIAAMQGMAEKGQKVLEFLENINV
ncbi:hypothetical protein [Pseudoalteromonas pernae]|uniref:hypothetical protein n=1 Tax=Pseudoalteromonas pernae TaxID=3118054 RepID=UPI003241EC51